MKDEEGTRKKEEEGGRRKKKEEKEEEGRMRIAGKSVNIHSHEFMSSTDNMTNTHKHADEFLYCPYGGIGV